MDEITITLQPHQVSALRYCMAYMRARFAHRLDPDSAQKDLPAQMAMRYTDDQLAEIEGLLG